MPAPIKPFNLSELGEVAALAAGRLHCPELSDGFTYDCQNPDHRDGIDLPDELFPTVAQARQLKLDPEICLNCQGL